MSGTDSAAPQVRCRVFGGTQRGGIFMTWSLGILATVAAIAAGLPAPLAAVALVGGIAYGLRRSAGTATYTLEADAIRRVWVPFAGGAVREDLRRVSDLRRWKLDHSVSRGFQRYEFLELDAARGPRWIITSRQDAAGFARFRDAFVARVHALDPDGRQLRRARSFYDTWWGKTISVVLAVAVAGLVAAAASGLVAITGVIQLAIFLVPGALYLLWRSFVRRR